MPYLSRHSLTYIVPTPFSGVEHIKLLNYRDILAQAVTISGTPSVQRDALIGAQWVNQIARGNASLSLSFAVTTPHADVAAAQDWAEDIHQRLILCPVGALVMESRFIAGMPTRTKEYTAGINRVDIMPMTSDAAFPLSPDAAWITLSLDMTLSEIHHF